MTRFLCITAFLLTFYFPAVAAPKPPSPPLPLEPFLHAPGMDGSIAGVEICDARTGEVLFAHNADTRLLPASNAKLFTAAAALELLGEDFTWTTKVVSSEPPDADGVLNSPLTIIGGGDASLVTADIDDLAAQIAKMGAKQVINRIEGDSRLFTDGPYGFGWEWDDFNDEEFPKISALTVNDGDLNVYVTGGAKAGDKPSVHLEPDTHDQTQVNVRTVLADETSSAPLQGIMSGSALSITGTIAVGKTKTLHLPVADPDEYVAKTLQNAFYNHHILVFPPDHRMGRGPRGFTTAFVNDGLPKSVIMQSVPNAAAPGFSGAPSDVSVLASHTSAPLSAYVTHMLKESDNLYAECLVRTVGVQKGMGGSFAAGYAAEIPALQKLGVDMTNVTLVDGCGVGRRNFVTAHTVCQLLVGMKKSPHWNTFYNALPIAGVDGTLKSRMKETPAANNCHAKTGTLGAVRALSGYVTGKNGTPYAFSILLNNFPGTARQAGTVQDSVVEWLATH